ncbi:MAG: gamma-glutamylcyclotransferase family protein [Planctomycetota bacterium]
MSEDRKPDSGPHRCFHVFVYGTLKRGQCREASWPKRPHRVQPAWIRGTLWTRPDYPALRDGNDRVFGECWTFDSAYENAVLQTLDAIEGTTDDDQPNLYDRVTCQTHLIGIVLAEKRSYSDEVSSSGLASSSVSAWTYRYAVDPQLDGFVRMTADSSGAIMWDQIHH